MEYARTRRVEQVLALLDQQAADELGAVERALAVLERSLDQS
jgi:hypothetical protein